MDIEQKKYPVEQFKIKFVKPTLDRECVSRITQCSHNVRKYFSTHIWPLHFWSHHNRASVIYTFIFSERGRCENKTLKRKARNGANSLLMTLIYWIRKRDKAKTLIPRRTSLLPRLRRWRTTLDCEMPDLPDTHRVLLARFATMVLLKNRQV